jgi:hypothetical protein
VVSGTAGEKVIAFQVTNNFMKKYLMDVAKISQKDKGLENKPQPFAVSVTLEAMRYALFFASSDS